MRPHKPSWRDCVSCWKSRTWSGGLEKSRACLTQGIPSAARTRNGWRASWSTRPGLGGLHALLGRAYLGWGEDATALEILLDGYRRYPADAELAALLGEQLWQAGEAELAFEYLGKGLGENPNDVPLLALTGRFLFEDGQDEAARGCLARAEALAPRHPALQQARVHIAATLAG